ncbi:MAG: HAMP domain-containing sensor histidine kinase [Pseudomonadota bacterium]
MVGFSSLAKAVERAFFGEPPKQLIDLGRAYFADPTLEREYRDYAIENELPKDLLINFAGIGFYYLFGILDFLTFDRHLAEILILRWAICGPIAIFIVSMSMLPQFRKHFKLGTASVMLIGSFSIVAMIALAPPTGAPPYIIGIFAVFILYACLQRMNFRTSITIYVMSFAAWLATVTVFSPKSEVEVLSGLFFFAWISIVSGVTTYIQEIRSRLDYYRNRQREEDAVYIQQLLIEATAADKAKLNFLSILSHELRTPLHQIIGFTEVLQANPDDMAPSHLAQIHVSAIQLLKRLGKMLRYADATAGVIRYEREPTDLSDIVAAVAEQAKEIARKTSVQIEVDAISPASLHIDSTHTIYALLNIVENAIAASSPGQTVTIAGRKLPMGGYEILISDAGGGMTAQQIDAAFKPFSIAQDVRTRTLEGVGLGLTLADKIFRDQRAKLTLQSQLGRGTTASIVFESGVKIDAA